MEESTEKKIRGRRIRMVRVAAVLAVVAMAVLLTRCSNMSAPQDAVLEAPVEGNAEAESEAATSQPEMPSTVTNPAAESPAAPAADASQDGLEVQDDSAQRTAAAGESIETMNADMTTGTDSPASSPKPSETSTSTAAQPAKTWVPDYKQIWIIDSAAWDESIPVYLTQEVSVCNICGAEITGNEAAHAKKHMLAGEGSGHHSEVRQVLTGYQGIHHAETGHWETVENGGHWE